MKLLHSSPHILTWPGLDAAPHQIFMWRGPTGDATQSHELRVTGSLRITGSFDLRWRHARCHRCRPQNIPGKMNGPQSPPPSHGFFSYRHTSINGQSNFIIGFGGLVTGLKFGFQKLNM